MTNQKKLAARIDEFGDALYRLIDELGLDFADLLPGEAQFLGGHLMLESPIFVLYVAEALGSRPELYPNMPTTAEELRTLQENATGWAFLRPHILWLLKKVSDSALRAQGLAMKKALSVVRQVEKEDALPYRFGLPDPIDRRQAILPAIQMLEEEKQRKARASRETKNRKRQQQGLPPIKPPRKKLKCGPYQGALIEQGLAARHEANKKKFNK